MISILDAIDWMKWFDALLSDKVRTQVCRKRLTVPLRFIVATVTGSIVQKYCATLSSRTCMQGEHNVKR